MVRDHGDDPVRHEAIAQHRERALEHAQLVVDSDADRLEERRKLWRTASRSKYGPNGADQVVAGLEGAVCSPPNDFARQSAGLRLVGVFPENPNQLVFVALVEYLSPIPVCVGTHPHVEWRAGAEREASSFLVDLVR
jgi:hypothetical protein